MSGALIALATVRNVLRIALLWTALVVAALATVDWLVRTRRIGSFSPVARFCRRYVDPLFAPVERRVVRAGGLPASAPWWTLAAVVLGGVIALALTDFLVGLLADAARGISGGPAGIGRLVLFWAFGFLQLAIIVRVIVSWLPVPPFSPWVRWAYTVSEPILAPLRRFIPLLGSIDVTPIVAFFLIGIVESLVRGVLG